MKLSTPVNIKKPEFKLTVDSVITGIGSCFAEYVMDQFSRLGFNISYNPNGIVYNSHSILKSIEHIVDNNDYSEETFVYQDDLWHSWLHHGSFSSGCKDELKKNIRNRAETFKKKLSESDLIIVTPSSSVVYCLKDNSRIVANCHKYQGYNFYRRLLSVEENHKYLYKTIKLIKNLNPDINIIITLSPVRHYPGNLTLNSVSKANLLSAINICLDENPCLYYFPSYEILLDELRSYRFYAEDMLHPSEMARKIIFKKFISAVMDEKNLETVKKREKEVKKSYHRQIKK
ncbi:MAG: GSCFA domain-containing protein [Victivallales bacterium]|nr:GSCFA domain-containing protein [Victivallales bacterium]